MRALVRPSKTAGQHRILTHRKLRLRGEPLEHRRLLAGDVAVSVSHGTLLITGDNADNFVEVFGSGTPGQFVVQGLPDNQNVNTTINHHTGQFTFNGVTNITVAMKRGDDFFGFENGNVAGNLCIDMSDGNDEVNVGTPELTTNSLSLPTAKAATVPVAKPAVQPAPISSATICGSLSINLGSGNNWLRESSTHVKGSESIDACDGNDNIELLDSGGIGGGSQTIGNGVIVDKDLVVNLGGGKNYIDAYDLKINGSLKVSGSGTNNVELAVINVAKDAVFSLCGKGTQDFSIEPDELFGDVPGIENHVGGNLTVTTGSCNDEVTESSLVVGGSNIINTDGGNDIVNLGEGLTGGPDPIDYSVTVGKDLCVNLGCGNDSLTANDVHVTGTFSAVQGIGNATINWHQVSANALKITTDGGKDDVTWQGVDGNTAMINLGSGNDTLSVTQCTISISTFDGGTGVNTYTDGGGSYLNTLTKKHFS